MSIFELSPGQSGIITHVNARGSVRQRLLDLGILPETGVAMIRVAPAGNPVWVKLQQGAQLALRRAEAEAVLVRSR